MRFCFATYVKILKQYSFNQSLSNERFVSELLGTYIDAGNIKNKQNKEFELNKSRISRLLANIDDVPMALRSAQHLYGFFENVLDGFADFVSDYIGRNSARLAVVNLCQIIANDDFLTKGNKEKILSTKDDVNKFLVTALFEAINLNNVIEQEEVVIWERGDKRA